MAKKRKPLFDGGELKRQTNWWAQVHWCGSAIETEAFAVIDPTGLGLSGGRLVGIATHRRRLPAAE